MKLVFDQKQSWWLKVYCVCKRKLQLIFIFVWRKKMRKMQEEKENHPYENDLFTHYQDSFVVSVLSIRMWHVSIWIWGLRLKQDTLPGKINERPFQIAISFLYTAFSCRYSYIAYHILHYIVYTTMLSKAVYPIGSACHVQSINISLYESWLDFVGVQNIQTNKILPE